MQRFSSAGLILLPLLSLALGAQPPPAVPVLDATGLTQVRVIDCPDGGTLTVDIGGAVATVHLLGIKATSPDDHALSLAQNGAAAKALLTELAGSEQVYLEPNRARNPANRGPRWPAQDEHGVLQAHVWRARDGLLLNAELLGKGLVFYASNERPREEYMRYYSWVQHEARDAHIGLWSSEQLVAAGLPPTKTTQVPAPGGVGGEMPGISLPAGAGAEEPPVEQPREVSGGVDSAAELPAGLTVEKASAKVTKRSRGGWDYAWIVGLRSDSARKLRLKVTVRFLDEEGYVLDEAVQRDVTLAARGRRELKGTHKLEATVAGKVASVSVLAERAR
jgi:hypothetical protein